MIEEKCGSTIMLERLHAAGDGVFQPESNQVSGMNTKRVVCFFYKRLKVTVYFLCKRIVMTSIKSYMNN